MRLTYRDETGRALLTLYGKQMYCSTQATADCIAKLEDSVAAYEDAKEQGRLVMLPCKVGDKVRDKISDYVFTIQTVELGHKAGTLFRCGNPGTEDYMAFYDFEIGTRIEILTREEAEASWKGGRADV